MESGNSFYCWTPSVSTLTQSRPLYCMAANSKGRQFGKRFATQIWAGYSRDPAPLCSFPASASRRAAHLSSYEKDIDDQVRPTVVPDHVISSALDGTYWGPHPQTGVFGPAEQSGAAATGGGGDQSSPPGSSGGGSSAMDQTVWFRPLEDVDKAPYA